MFKTSAIIASLIVGNSAVCSESLVLCIVEYGVSSKTWGDAQAAEAAWFEREGALRREVAAQEERLRSQEVQKAELAAASADGTRPLLRYGQARAPCGQPPTSL